MRDDRPSATALVVATNIAVVAATPALAHLVPADAAALTTTLLEAYGRPRWALQWLQTHWGRFLFALYERCTIPGLALHQALRKQYMEQVVRAGIADGYQQVVVLGGGLDTLALRLHREYPHVVFLELDHPNTQRLKRETSEQRQLAGSNLRFQPIDLATTPLTEALRGIEAYTAQQSIFICEGVLMYLEPTEVDQVFAALRQQSGTTRFVFTLMVEDTNGAIGFRNSTWLVRLWLQLKREPFRWGLREGEIEAFLVQRGFEPFELVTTATDSDFQSGTVAQGEVVCVADADVSREH